MKSGQHVKNLMSNIIFAEIIDFTLIVKLPKVAKNRVFSLFLIFSRFSIKKHKFGAVFMRMLLKYFISFGVI